MRRQTIDEGAYHGASAMSAYRYSLRLWRAGKLREATTEYKHALMCEALGRKSVLSDGFAKWLNEWLFAEAPTHNHKRSKTMAIDYLNTGHTLGTHAQPAQLGIDTVRCIDDLLSRWENDEPLTDERHDAVQALQRMLIVHLPTIAQQQLQ